MAKTPTRLQNPVLAMSAHDRSVIHGSEESDYRTPLEVIEPLDTEFGGFSLDVAATKQAALAPQYCGPDHVDPAMRDGLSFAWSCVLGVKWMNNPYSKKLMDAYRLGYTLVDGVKVPHEQDQAKSDAYDMDKWAWKAWYESVRGNTVVAIVPAAIQTGWWQSFVWGGCDSGYRLKKQKGQDRGEPILHRASEIRHLPHRVAFLKPDGTPTSGAGVNHAIVVWRPFSACFVEPWTPQVRFWSYRRA